MGYIWINLLSKNERKEMEKKKTSESEEGVHFIYVVMIVIAEAEKGKTMDSRQSEEGEIQTRRL